MIVNIPTQDSLNDVALRLHFSAWSELVDMRLEFEAAFPASPGYDWKEEWIEYIDTCQPDLQSICALIQQSSELALKAKVCAVSPFLLLLKSERKLSTTPKDVDFSEFKTLDAVDLPGAVNTFCSEFLSDKFIESYGKIRSLRNKIEHLGHVSGPFTPEELLHVLIFHYTELWNDRVWLNDRVRFASRSRVAFFHDSKYTSTQMEVMHELPYTLKLFTKSEFRKLFGRGKDCQRYLCHECIDSAETKYAVLDLEASKTAFLDETGESLCCAMCRKNLKVTRSRCRNTDCKGNVIGDNNDDYVGMCHVCGEGGVQGLLVDDVVAGETAPWVMKNQRS